MSFEMWQFAAFLGVVAVAFVLWLNIIYLPGRTLEQRYDGPGASESPGTPPGGTLRKILTLQKGVRLSRAPVIRPDSPLPAGLDYPA